MGENLNGGYAARRVRTFAGLGLELHRSGPPAAAAVHFSRFDAGFLLSFALLRLGELPEGVATWEIE